MGPCYPNLDSAYPSALPGAEIWRGHPGYRLSLCARSERRFESAPFHAKRRFSSKAAVSLRVLGVPFHAEGALTDDVLLLPPAWEAAVPRAGLRVGLSTASLYGFEPCSLSSPSRIRRGSRASAK